MRAIFVSFAVLVCLHAQAYEYPDTREEATVDTYHGVQVKDPYQWLENWSSEEVKEWSAAQNLVARKLLDSLPNREEIAARLNASLSDTESYYLAERVGGVAWFMKFAPPKQQAFIVSIDSTGDPESEKIVFDPVDFDPTGSTSIQWFKVSPDGRLIAVALTEGGSEVADLYILGTADGQQVDQIVPRVNIPTAAGDLCWDADSSGFYYTRYPLAGERPTEDMNFYQQLWHRKLGTALSDDTYELGQDFDRISEIRVNCHQASGKLLATVQFGDGGKFDMYVRDSDSAWHQIAEHNDEYVQATFIDENNLLILSRSGAPNGKFVRMGIDDLPRTTTSIIVEESKDALVSDFYGTPPFIVYQNKIYARAMIGGPEELRVYSLSGEPLPTPNLGVVGLGQLVPWDDGVLVRQYSYLTPNAWILLKGDKLTRHPLSTSSPVSFEGYKAIREFALSADGTRVPVNIIMAESTKLDGKTPLLLSGYGGYGISLTPFFNPTDIVWLEQGGIVAIANLRGGGEYGDEWHRQGMLTNKQNVFDDFYAVMKRLVNAGYTSVNKLAIEGGSNGGLLIGAMLTQHPSDFQVAISHVGIFDMLRFELSPNGAFNVPEFGTVKNQEQFEALYRYSPYHRVKKAKYPSTLLLTGENDGRVDPMHSRKMVAMLQRDNLSDNPILLRTSGDTGHGIGTPLDEQIFLMTDRFVFLFDAIDMKYESVH
jgi:prolyl oligopeptidase